MVVLDEYGGVSGVVTMNDLVEELVGDFNEEESPRILPAGIDRWKVLGNVPLDAISEITGVDLDENDNDSFNGMMYQQLGRVPEDGERCSFVIKTCSSTSSKSRITKSNSRRSSKSKNKKKRGRWPRFRFIDA